MDKPRNTLITDVELNWAKVDAPVAPFGQPQWEVQIATTDAAKAEEFRKNHLKVKEVDGKFVVSLKRPAVRKDGSDNEPVRLVDANKAPMADRRGIGNGSRGNVIVWQAQYDYMGRKGITSILSAIQVTDLVEFSGSGVDFDVVAGSGDVADEAMF